MTYQETMIEKLDLFIQKITHFEKLSPAEKVDYFVYFLQYEKSLDFVRAKDVELCFEESRYTGYSNISVYLSRNSKGKKNKFKTKGNGYILERTREKEIISSLGEIELILSNNLFPFEILEKTRGYLKTTAKQASLCYDYKLYDASLVMIRKLLETLIIDLFEKRNMSSNIKDVDGNYFFLSNLIPIYLKSDQWSLSRNTKKSLPKIKSMGDLSAHNRHFNAKKKDIDDIKGDLRIVMEELVHLIDY